MENNYLQRTKALSENRKKINLMRKNIDSTHEVGKLKRENKTMDYLEVSAPNSPVFSSHSPMKSSPCPKSTKNVTRN